MGINRCRHMGNFRNNGNEMENSIDVIRFVKGFLIYCENKPLIKIDKA